MPISLISKIKPKNSGLFPVYEDVDVEGGFQTRDSTTDRDSIPSLNRKAGMLVFTRLDGYFYKLGTGLTNSDWSLLQLPIPNLPNATTTSKGIVQLTGDLSGTATAPTVVNLHIASQILGDTLYFTGTNWVRLGIGSSNQVLTVNSGIPSWQVASGGTSAYSDGYVNPALGATTVQGAVDAIKQHLAPDGYTPISGSKVQTIWSIGGLQSTGSIVSTAIGNFRFNPTDYSPLITSLSRKINLKVFLQSTNTLVAEVRLYNVTDSGYVTGTTMTTTSGSPALLDTGNIAANFSLSSKTYEIQIRLQSTLGSGDRATCTGAILEITY